MKEQFRHKIPSGNMRTKYWIDKEASRYAHWETSAETLTSQISSVVRYYQSIDIRLTNRQLYYQLVGKDLIPNAHEVYKRICTFLTDLRYAGIIDWGAIEDKARVPIMHAQWNNVCDLIETAVSAYRLPRWEDQRYYVEMYCEKEAGVNVLSPICNKYHIYFGFNKGYSSASAMYELAGRIKDQIDIGKEVIILYFGDHDPSGLDMVRDIRERIEEFLTKGSFQVTPNFSVIPISLTMDQIKEYSPPPNPAKITDPRAKWYINKFGKASWELDAIDAIELRKMAEEAVLQYIDVDKYNDWIAREKLEISALRKFGENYETE
jgi:hypothetical protein